MYFYIFIKRERDWWIDIKSNKNIKILQNTHLEITDNILHLVIMQKLKRWGNIYYIVRKCVWEAQNLAARYFPLSSVFLINQRGKKRKNLSNWHPAEKSGIGTLSPSRAVARNLRARRISSTPRRSYSSMKLSLTILDLPWRGSFSLSTPLILHRPPRSFLNCVPRLAGSRETFPFAGSKDAKTRKFSR